ncbi:MAG: Unknown protein [uncultured Aureispira sp.]|uniref:Lipoprotein n=1 Tax=uncultured Aureispira sp. TaxID=1331704 RepID=A0A6S6SER8_9BACT|nr:MAG: Unknown protein [uncultured Aureispira sp.]
MKLLCFFLFFLLIACQDSTSNKQNSKDNNTPSPSQVIKETSPKARFEQFIAQFPSLQLPATLDANRDFKRLDAVSIERVLGVESDPDFGLKKSINCIGTFKVHDFIAVLYQSSERPNKEHSPTYIKMALYTPYGALKGETILGKNQQTEHFTEAINLLISANFTIRVEHNIDSYVSHNKQLNPYHSFYATAYKLTAPGEIQLTKEVKLWEKIPAEFVAPFVVDQKKNPTSSTVSIEYEGQKAILKSNEKQAGQVIVQALSDSLLFVSSLEMEPIETATDSFYVNSKVALIQLKNNHLKIVSPQFIPFSTWPTVYKAIQEHCNCAPAPAANENGLINLTLLETPLHNAVFADFNLEKQAIEFVCNQNGHAADSSFYTLDLNY